jgi:creatinine amidohydrolase
MLLQLSTWCEVDKYLENSKGIVIPIGSTEQHGPNGLIGTDSLCPEIIADYAGEVSLKDNAPMMIAPTFNVGIAQHHMGFSGSMTLRPATFISVMVDWVDSLTTHGFTHFYFFNGHGGNIATIQAGFAEIYAQRSLVGTVSKRIRLKLRNWWDGSETFGMCKKLYGSAHGSHATPSEVAVTQFAFPNHIKSAPDMSPDIAPNGRFTDAVDYRRNFPDGRMGSNPALATPEHGEKLVEISAKETIADYKNFMEMDI